MSLGERLLKWREDRHVQISDVSRNTGIQALYVEYLERGEFEKLPAEVYVRGFLRRYAEFLGVPEEPLLRQYERERGMNRSIGSTRSEEESAQRSAFRNIPAAIITPARITIASFTLLGIAAFLYVYAQYRTFVSEPTLVIFEPTAEAMRMADRFVQVSGKTDPDSRIYINDQPVLVNENGEFREKIDLQKGVNTVTVRSINRFNKEAKRVFSIEANFSEGEQGGVLPSQEGTSLGKKVVIRTGKDPMLVVVTVDGERKVDSVAPAGSRWEFSVKNEMMISAGDGKGIYATIGEEGAESALSGKAGPISGYKLDMKNNFFVP